MQSKIELASPGKINLFLKILGKRDDGYHELLTRMVMLSCFDLFTIEFDQEEVGKEPGRVKLAVKGREIDGDPQENLVVRAARMVLEKLGNPSNLPIRITLEKNIPVGAGLGGGSSNAAAALIGTNRLMGGKLGKEELVQMASLLGSDVPFFLGGAHALGWGRGEKVLPLPAESGKTVLLWNPGFSLSTGLVYKSLSVPKTKELTEAEAIFRIEGLLRENVYVNDLEEIALRLHPELTAVKDSLSKMGAGKAMISGSGPTVFGLFFQKAMAEEAAFSLASIYGGWSGVFRTLEISPLS